MALLCGLALSGPALAQGKAKPTSGAADRGDFKVSYSGDPQYEELEELLKEAHIFEETAAELNALFSLPRDIAIVLAPCGEVNAFYDSENGAILMCHELMASEAEAYATVYDTEEEVDEAVVNSTLFTFFHELGHALIDQLDIPVTGKEEDAVDQLATSILVELGEEGEKAALDGAVSFGISGEEESTMEELPYWDEHSLSSQRFYNIACWVYGTDPEKYDYLVTEGHLPEERAGRCEGEFAQMARSWGKLLDPYMKNP